MALDATTVRQKSSASKIGKYIWPAIVIAYLLYEIGYPWVVSEMSRPQEPAKTPLFTFMKQLDLVGEPQSTGEVEVSGGVDHEYPCWYYLSALNSQALAHNLKRSLTKSKGWSLAFPDLNDPYEAKAEHRIGEKVDWTLETVSGSETGPSDLIITYRRLINQKN